MKGLKKRTDAELALTLDVLLDSAYQIMMKNPTLTEKKKRRVTRKLKQALAVARVLMGRFDADRQVNLKRCSNKDELPWEHKRGSGTRGIMRKNWRAYVRQRELKKLKPLTEFMEPG